MRYTDEVPCIEYKDHRTVKGDPIILQITCDGETKWFLISYLPQWYGKDKGRWNFRCDGCGRMAAKLFWPKLHCRHCEKLHRPHLRRQAAKKAAIARVAAYNRAQFLARKAEAKIEAHRATRRPRYDDRPTPRGLKDHAPESAYKKKKRSRYNTARQADEDAVE